MQPSFDLASFGCTVFQEKMKMWKKFITTDRLKMKAKAYMDLDHISKKERSDFHISYR